MICRLYGGISVTSNITLFLDDSFFFKSLSLLLPFYSASVDRKNGISWKWTPAGDFSCASTYKISHHTWEIALNHNFLWKLKIPMKVRIFIWLMIENKILTQEVLQNQGCTVQPSCHLCNMNCLEILYHIMWSCPYASAFRRGFLAHYNLTFNIGGDIRAKWDLAQPRCSKLRGIHINKVWSAWVWALWRKKNRKLFWQKEIRVPVIQDTRMSNFSQEIVNKTLGRVRALATSPMRVYGIIFYTL